MSTRRPSDPHRTDDLVAFFRTLPPEARRDYAALAALDRRFGEDVAAERRARRADPEKDEA